MDENFRGIWEAEAALLLGANINDATISVPHFTHLQRGEFDLLIKNSKVEEIFNFPGDSSPLSDKPMELFKNLVNTYLSNHPTVQDQFEVLCIGIACLNGFIQSNWTGPEFSCSENLLSALKPSVKHCFNEDIPCYSDFSDCVRLVLSEDGEEINVSVVYPELLIAALSVFSSHLPELRTPDWWLLRASFIHQQVLDEFSPTLLDLFDSLCNKILNYQWLDANEHLKVLAHLEIARIYLYYGKISSSDKEILNALSMLKMVVNLSGALGKRTYYQIREVAQITINVKVDRDSNFQNGIEFSDVDFPKNIQLNDDVRMPNIAFSNPTEGSFPDLLPLEQAAIVAMFAFKKKSQAQDHLQTEELLPFIHCILSHPKVWAFQLSALYFRSKLECDHKRSVERSLLQTQALMELNNNNAPVNARLYFFFCSYAPPSFYVASTCASILSSLGSIQSALDIYLKLQMWDEVIFCYNHLKLRHKAAEVIREQIAKRGESIRLLCFLGDATDDVSCYERAWELSNHRSAQAQRHWGMFYFNKRMYKESIEHLNISLSKNSLQIALWFRLGYANLMEHKWEDSAAAYRRYCALEPGSFEAWNNMAKAYILTGQKRRAYYALQEAIKCNFDTWQVWDNLMAVSFDCGEFEEVINCYHRILDLKERHIDEQILSILTSVIVKGVKDCQGRPASSYRKKVLELFGRLTSKEMGNPTIWRLYAELTATIEDQTPITRSKVIQYYQKAYAVTTQDTSWFKDFESMKKVLTICDKYAEGVLALAQDSSSNEAAQFLPSVKFSLTNVLAKVNEQIKNLDKTEVPESFQSDVSSLQRALESVQAELIRIKNC